MTVTVTQPSINVREKLAELDKPTGIAGEAMLRADTPQEQFNLIGAGRRNLIINGDFQVWQRGTSGTSGYVADRFKGVYGTSQSKQYDADIGNYVQITTNNAAIMYYGVELMETGKSYPFFVDHTYTLSCKIKSTSKITAINFGWRDGVASGTYTDIPTYTAIKEHTGSGEWEDVVYQVTVSAAPHANAKVFQINFIGTSGVQYNIAQVQLELGKVATPFDHSRSYGEELALCQRYFQQLTAATNNAAICTTSLWTSGTSCYGVLHLPTELRTAPTVSVSGTFVVFSGGGTTNVTSVGGGSNFNGNSVELVFNHSAIGSAGNSAWIRMGSTGNYVALDAEL